MRIKIEKIEELEKSNGIKFPLYALDKTNNNVLFYVNNTTGFVVCEPGSNEILMDGGGSWDYWCDPEIVPVKIKMVVEP